LFGFVANLPLVKFASVTVTVLILVGLRWGVLIWREQQQQQRETVRDRARRERTDFLLMIAVMTVFLGAFMIRGDLWVGIAVVVALAVIGITYAFVAQ
jgi:hypothetical protein